MASRCHPNSNRSGAHRWGLIMVAAASMVWAPTSRGEQTAARVYPAYASVDRLRPTAAIRATDQIDQRILGVGDLGRIRLSEDGGASWSEIDSPTQATLRDVRWFDRDRVVVVGGYHRSMTGIGVGVVLVSIDGGRSFVLSPDRNLPPLYQINDRSSAGQTLHVTGCASNVYGTGRLMSRDGGRSWQADADVILPIADTSNSDDNSNPSDFHNHGTANSTATVFWTRRPTRIPWSVIARETFLRGGYVELWIDRSSRPERPQRYRIEQAALGVGVHRVRYVDPDADPSMLDRVPVVVVDAAVMQRHPRLRAYLTTRPAAALPIRALRYDFPSTDATDSDAKDGFDGDRLVPDLGRLLSDYNADATRLIAPMMPPSPPATVSPIRGGLASPAAGSDVPLPPSMTRFDPQTRLTTRHGFETSRARLSDRRRVARWVDSLTRRRSSVATTGGGAAVDVTTMVAETRSWLTRTDARDRLRLAWSLARSLHNVTLGPPPRSTSRSSKSSSSKSLSSASPSSISPSPISLGSKLAGHRGPPTHAHREAAEVLFGVIADATDDPSLTQLTDWWRARLLQSPVASESSWRGIDPPGTADSDGVSLTPFAIDDAMAAPFAALEASVAAFEPPTISIPAIDRTRGEGSPVDPPTNHSLSNHSPNHHSPPKHSLLIDSRFRAEPSVLLTTGADNIESVWKRIAASSSVPWRTLASPHRMLTCRVAERAPRLDGRLDQPIRNPSESFELAIDGDYLYVNVAADVMPPRGVDATTGQPHHRSGRDGLRGEGPRLQIEIDPSGTLVDGVTFEVDGYGATRDYRQSDLSVDPTWYVAVPSDTQPSAGYELAIRRSDIGLDAAAFQRGFAIRVQTTDGDRGSFALIDPALWRRVSGKTSLDAVR